MMFINSWGEVFRASLLNLWYGFINFVPGLFGAVILFIIGWLIGSLVGKAIAQLVSALRVERLFEQAGAKDFFNRAGIKLSVGGFLGAVVKWFIIVLFLISSLQIIGLTQVNNFLTEAVLFYLPRVIVAALVLVIATVLADAMKRLVEASAQAAHVRSARMLGAITRYSIWIFAFIIALSELGIATAFMQILFTGLVVALALAAGLAFGLGGKEAASRAIQRMSSDMGSEM
jgi:small-conductance mechanosensitive channel